MGEGNSLGQGLTASALVFAGFTILSLLIAYVGRRYASLPLVAQKASLLKHTMIRLRIVANSSRLAVLYILYRRGAVPYSSIEVAL